MDIEMVLNELSIRQPAPDSFTARAAMSTLLRTVASAVKQGAPRVLRVHRTLSDELLAPGYTVGRWRNDSAVDREEQRQFRSLVTKAPYLSDLPERAAEADNIECYCEGECAIGLGIAWLLDGLPVSLIASPRWDLPSLHVNITELDEAGDLVELAAILPHAGRPEHITVNAGWFQERLAWARSRRFENIHSGKELWHGRVQLFERLRFCDEVERQLESVDRFPDIIAPILKRLYELDEYCRSWQDGPFDPKKLVSKASTESQATLGKYEEQRIFTWEHQKRLFSWHVRLTPGAWRIYFEPDAQQHIFYIGYIGTHLATVKYGT